MSHSYYKVPVEVVIQTPPPLFVVVGEGSCSIVVSGTAILWVPSVSVSPPDSPYEYTYI